MMDIYELLRAVAGERFAEGENSTGRLLENAANEIDRLRAENEDLYKSLSDMLGCFGEIAGDTADAEESEREEAIVSQAHDALSKVNGDTEA